MGRAADLMQRFTQHLAFRSAAWQPPHRALWSEVHVPLEATRQALVHAGHWAVREPGCDICEDEVGGPHPHPGTGRLHHLLSQHVPGRVCCCPNPDLGGLSPSCSWLQSPSPGAPAAIGSLGQVDLLEWEMGEEPEAKVLSLKEALLLSLSLAPKREADPDL